MAFIDLLGKKIAQTGQDAAQKTRNMAENVKLSSEISDEEKKIRQQYTTIGEMYNQLYGEHPAPEFVESIAAIRESQAKIQMYRERIQTLKGVTVCAQCGTSVPGNAPFCNACGARMVYPDAVATPKCPHCGAALPPDTVFCTSCGQKIPDEMPAPEHEPEAVAETLCPDCGQSLRPGAQFCPACGKKLL